MSTPREARPYGRRAAAVLLWGALLAAYFLFPGHRVLGTTEVLVYAGLLVVLLVVRVVRNGPRSLVWA